jgi:membrane-associated phospholipid phosphatase
MDALVMLEAVALTADLNGASKDAFARRRPSAGLGATGGGNKSFFSGHTSLAFALAASAGTISTLRGYPSAPWVWAGGMALASSVGYLRIAGDAHWATDVVTGAVVGGLVGFAVPWAFHRVHRTPRSFDLVASAGGVALLF